MSEVHGGWGFALDHTGELIAVPSSLAGFGEGAGKGTRKKEVVRELLSAEGDGRRCTYR